MNSLLCRRCNGQLRRQGKVHAPHYTTSQNHFITAIGPSITFPVASMNDSALFGTAPGINFWPCASTVGAMAGMTSEVSQGQSIGSGFLPSFNHPTLVLPVPDFGPSMGAMSPGEDQLMVSQPGTADTGAFAPIDEVAIGLLPPLGSREVVLPNDEGIFTRSASSSTYSVPSLILDDHIGMNNPFAPAGAAPTYPCLEENCTKVFKKLCSLKQHERTHTRPEVCRHCVRQDGTPMRFADKKGLRRHMGSKHPNVVEDGVSGIELGSKDRRVCPFDGCSYEQREDNVSRHHMRVHGVRIRWKKGVAYPCEATYEVGLGMDFGVMT